MYAALQLFYVHPPSGCRPRMPLSRHFELQPLAEPRNNPPRRRYSEIEEGTMTMYMAHVCRVTTGLNAKSDIGFTEVCKLFRLDVTRIAEDWKYAS